ncbi:wd domain-containing protein [Colletotrichum incanum]|uniref:Wd domain-containing protein n=1 Tax=Colletotrichum incanum TaxID=1573173 RepID=A0A162PGF7_COLIC|nr:wd domain-containing protein [Colletotrichum incanum]OHW89951.1 signal recognition particle 9 kDa protein [Colletotrichum incanum]
MPTYKTSQEWLEQSSLLLQARPATTRITTKYSIKPVKPRKSKTSTEDATVAEDALMTDAKPPRGSLVLKTFDPASGVTLKYRTTKAAEVSRLVTCLGTLGRTMSTSKAPVEVKDEPMTDAIGSASGVAGAPAAGEDTPIGGVGGAPTPAGAGGGGGKKKKKGKK